MESTNQYKESDKTLGSDPNNPPPSYQDTVNHDTHLTQDSNSNEKTDHAAVTPPSDEQNTPHDKPGTGVGNNKLIETKIDINDGHNSKNNYMNGDSQGDKILRIGDSSGANNGGSKKKKKERVPMVGFIDLFKYASRSDKMLMFIGSIGAIGHGATMPLMVIVFGDMLDSFVNNAVIVKGCELEGAFSEELIASMTGSIQSKMGTFALFYCGIAIGVILCAYTQMTLWTLAANRQVDRLRKAFYRSVLRQEIAWFDTHRTGELATEMATGIIKIQAGIGDKIAIFIQWIASCLAGFIIGFVYGWKLTLVILAVSPLLAVAAALMSKFVASLTKSEMKAYTKAGAIAEEVLSSIRTVKAFNGEVKASNLYGSHLGDAERAGIKRGLTSGLGMGITWLIIFATYAFGFWYGFTLVRDSITEGTDDYSAGTLLTVFFAVIIGAFSLGNAAPCLSDISAARGAAVNVYKVIESRSNIDSLSEDGERPVSITGIIQFHDVHFCYPTRPDVPVLKGMHLKICVGETIALVGESGCGKSTIAQLTQRFYDPIDGKITLDGENIKNLNVRWLRQQMGTVGQEPVLFSGTIAENIEYGCEKEVCSQQDIETAARNANAHDFIMMLPEKYNTQVGERGAQLSGGQKQRIAIARALIRNPRLIILDEATSALDNESEATVQSFLRSSSKERATIVIAHRLTTVMNADKILVVKDGVVVEEGKHGDLMRDKKFYYDLVTAQTLSEDTSGQTENTVNKKMTINAIDDEVLLTAAESHATNVIKAKSQNNGKSSSVPMSMARVFKYNKPEGCWILLGSLSALIGGGAQPAFAVIFAEILGVFAICDVEEQEEGISMYCLLFLVIGFIAGLAMLGQSYCFGKSGEALTKRLRHLTFDAILCQEIAYFDDDNNTVGALTSRLATDASQVQGATGARLGTFAQSISNMGVAIVIAFVFGWQLTLLIIAFVPFMIAAGVVYNKLLTGDAESGKALLESGSQIIIETFNNIRTVASITKENLFCCKFEKSISNNWKQSSKRAHFFGASVGFSQSIMYFAYAASFYLGGYLVETGEMTYRDVFLVFGAIVFGAMGMGQASTFAPDYAKAKISATHIFAVLDRVPKINNSLDHGEKFVDFKGNVCISHVSFKYPTRPDITVLNDLDIAIKPGQTVALVGHSGCGKSTVVQLLERFYSPDSGQILIDGMDANSLNVPWLRSQIGIVSQEPVLFDTSIQQNISYGDNSRNEIPITDIIDAAKQANIHEFITSLPTGYDTNVGNKGTQLSGGQKQRIAIARAVIRNPKILLLDEATSALDAESEEVVQAALDQASEGRTCLVIAHRLSTIRNADCIMVIQDGQVTERGTHDELMALGGVYYNLNTVQLNSV